MATNSFMQDPFDKLADDLNAQAVAPLPGQQAATPTQEAPDVTKAATPAKTKPTATADAPEQEAAPSDTRRPAKASNWLPPANMVPTFDAAAKQYDVPVNVLMALAHQESRYNPSIIGTPTQWGRAKGAMQYLDATASGLGINPLDPDQAIPAAAKQIRERLNMGYSMEDAVKEHFAGPDRKKWGAKTAAYGTEVMGKATKIGDLLMGGASGPAVSADSGVPKDWVKITPEEAAAIQAKQSGTTPAAAPIASPAAAGIVDNAADVGKGLKVGWNTAAQDVRELVGRIPGIGQPIVKAGDAVDKFFTGKDSGALLAGDSKAMTASMTPQMQGALEKKWYDSATGKMGPAWADWRSYTGGLVQSLPEQALTMGPSMVLAKAAYAAKIAAGASAAIAGQAAARTAMVAGGISEGALGGAQSARDVRETVNNLKPEILAQSDAYKALINTGLAPDAAKKALAEDLSTRAFVTSGIVTGMFGGMGDRAIAKIFTQQVGGGVVKNALKNFGKGAVAEGLLEELPQSAGQQLAQNEAIRKADPTRALSHDVINQGLGGVAIGGLQGGGMGAMAGSRSHAPAPADVAPEVTPIVPPTQAPVQPAESAPPAPSTGKPLSTAVEGAAEAPQRVVVDTPGGPVAGTLQAYKEDAQGGFSAQVVDDNGQVVTITDQDGVQITPVAPPSGPLTGAVEQAAAEHAATQPAPAVPAEAAATPLEQSAATTPSAPEAAAPPKNADGYEVQDKNGQSYNFKINRGAEGEYSSASIEHDDGTHSRLEWKEKKKSFEVAVINLSPKLQGNGLGTSLYKALIADAFAKGKTVESDSAVSTDALRVYKKLQAEGYGVEFNKNTTTKKISEGRDRILSAGPGPVVKVVSIPTTTEAVPAAVPRQQAETKQIVDMTDAELRTRMKYVTKQANTSGWDKRMIEARKEISDEINARVAAAPTTTKEATDVLPKPVDGIADASAKPVAMQPAVPAVAEPGAGRADPVANAGNEPAALKDAHAGQLFPTQAEADAYVAKKAAGATHEVVKTGKVRFEVKPRAATPKGSTNAAGTRLRDDPASWVIREKSTGKVIMETFDRKKVDALNTEKYEAIPIQDHLVGINEAIKAEAAAEQQAAPAATVESAAPAKTQAKKLTGKAKAAEEASRKGEVGGKMAAGEMVLTASGRATTPFPQIKVDTSRKATSTVKAVDTWLMQNALDEAQSRGDNFNARQFQANLSKPSQADKDASEEYLFGQQPDVVPSILKTLVPEKAPAPEAPNTAGIFDGNKLFTADKVAAARARMKSKMTQLNSGLDPELVMDGMTLAGAYIEAGTRKFSAYAKAMTDDFGAAISPYLLSFYEAVRHYPGLDTDGMSTPEVAKKQHEAMLLDASDTTKQAQPAAIGEPSEKTPIQAQPTTTLSAPAEKTEAAAPAAPAVKTEIVATPSGREFEVRHKVVEAADLVTSNRDDGSVNPAFPAELQPRDRSRASSQGQVNDIANTLNPRLLGESASATDGAPIVSPGNLVESGNGRTMAIRRAYERDLPGASKYRAWLEQQGHDVAGMKAPVLVRERITPMTIEETRDYTREANDRTTLDLSPTERAMADAEKVGAIMSLYQGGEVDAAGNREFVRAFMSDVAAKTDRGGLMDAGGILSQGGRRRIEAAMLAAAYDDAAVVADLFESGDSDIKAIGGALLDASGDWAKMRDEAKSGAISSGVDVTKNLIEAVNVVRRARAEGRPVIEFVQQDDIFAGGMDPVTSDFMRVFYRGDSMNRARGRDKVSEALRYYSTQARQSKPGQNLFGDPELTGAELLKATNERTKAQDGQAGQQSDIFASPRPVDPDAGKPGEAGQGSRAGAGGEATPEGGVNVPDTNAGMERDSGVAGTEPAVGDAVPAAPGATDAGARKGRDGAGTAGRGRADNPGIPAGGPVVVGERGDQQFPGGKPGDEPARFDAGINDGERSGDSGITGAAPDAIPAAQVKRAATTGVSDAEKRSAQRDAASVKSAPGLDNIRATLPYLLAGQQEDVFKAETRFAEPDGYGMLFTNGTGTGKTFTGLGIVKRFERAGKNNILIVVPDDKIAADWIESGRALDIDITALRDTKDAGKGVVITSYANLGANDALATRQWDLVLPDESHMLMQDKNGTPTSYLNNLRAITHHPDGAYTRFTMLNQADIDKMNATAKELDALQQERANPATEQARNAVIESQIAKLMPSFEKQRAALDAKREANKAEVTAKQGAGRTRAVFLSATPFAYEKTIDWANGYLFDYNQGRKSEKGEFRGYNTGTNREQFFMQHLGYEMHTNKLNEPRDPKLDRGLLQRQFNGMLKKSGSLSGRMLDVPFDYDRRFISVDSAIGTQIDEALDWLSENSRGEKTGGVRALQDYISEKFDYLSRRYLLEAVKATEAVPIVKQHMAMGRKVVVFHDYKKGGGFNPFDVKAGAIVSGDPQQAAAIKDAVERFRQQFPTLVGMPFSEMKSPIETFREAFPGVLLINGDEKKSDLLKRYKSFQDDANGPQVMLVQSAKNKGWSGHDTTGKHQRVLINLGQPTQPTLSIQQEGRVYRTGQASDAIFRYLNTGTNWEKWAFATTIATRASAAENLGMGELSRALKDAYISAFEESDTFPPGHEGEGKGGKERDKASNESITEYDRAKTFYRATTKKNAKTKAQEGVDYFATPEPVGLKMVEWLDARPGEDTAEPSGGHGAIARWLPESTNRTVVEPSLALRSRMAMVLNGDVKIVDGTFEELNVVNKFDGIVMNPPFGSGGKTAIEHLAKAATHLRDGGRVVALIPTGPAADKRFDKWFYETVDRPVKPAYTSPTLGAVYKGDTVTTNAAWAPQGVVVGISPETGMAIKIPGQAGVTRVNLLALRGVEPTGPRTESVNLAAGLHMIADVKMPAVTFERAGTAVATRIVVIEKQNDPKKAPAGSVSNRDLTDITSVNELFDRMENIVMPARVHAAPVVQQAAQSPAQRAPTAAQSRPAPAAMPRGGRDIITVTTKAGKELRGVIRADMTLAQAKEIDPHTWVPMIDGRKAAGPFIREKYLAGVAPKFSVSPRAGAALTTDTLRGAVTEGALGPVVGSLIDAGLIVLHETPATLPRNVGNQAGGIQAVTTPDGKVHMVAGNLTAKNARAVMLHEAFHQGGENLIGTQQWDALMRRAGQLYRQANQSQGQAKVFFDKARARVFAAYAQGAVEPHMEVEEFAAYAIEEYEQAPATVRKWVDDLIGAVKAWAVKRFGAQLGAVTPAQLSALAKMAVLDVAASRRGEVFGKKGDFFSVADTGTRADPAPADAQAEADEIMPPGLTPPEQGRFRKLQAALQNNQNRVRQVQDRIEKVSGAPLSQSTDHYLAETNRPGRVAARLEDAERQLTGPLMERLAKSKHTQEQLSELLHAMHAGERNAKIAEFNQDMPDGGSGMTTADADKILEKYGAARELHAIADQARGIARATLDLKLAYGLIKEEDHEQLATVYENYVPLKGDGEFGPKIKRAMGHDGREEHILENLSRDYNQAVVVGEKNLARQSLLRMVLANPDGELWTVGVPPRGRRIAGQTFLIKSGGETIASFDTLSQATAFAEGKGGNVEITDTKGERIQEYVRPLQDNEVMVYVKGDPVRIQIKDTQLAAQLRPLDQGAMNPILEFMRGTNRYLSKIYTGYNPAFILRNATRDAMTGTISMLGNNGAAVAASAWAKYPAAVTTLARWAATSKTPDTKTGAYLTEYRMHGGKVGASWMSDLEANGKKLSTMYEDAYGATNYAREGKPTKAAIVAGRKIVGGLAHVVEIGNQATENALRLSLYMAMRERGATPGKAAQAAKTVTVDFDRKGTMTGAMGAIYLFFNPAIQGSANALKTLTQGAHKEQAWAALGSLAMLGAYLASRGMDDDKDRWLGEGWETRSKNMIWNIGGHQIRVPVSQEYAPAFALGMALGEAGRGESKMKSAARVLSSFIDAYFPLQGAYRDGSDNPAMDLSLAATPTMLKPFAQSAANRSSFGSQVVPENTMTKDRPDNLKMFRGTKNTAYDKAAQSIASFGELTGAGKYENDITKVSPETLKMLWRTYTGGLGTFVTDSLGVAGMTASDPGQVEATDVPILKDFYKANDVKAIRGRYYDLTHDARGAITEFEQAKKAGDGEAMEKLFDKPEKAQMIGVGKMVKAVNKSAAAIRDGEVDVNADANLTPAQKRAALKDLEKQEEELYRSAIEAFK